MVCAGRGEKHHLPRVSSLTLAGFMWAVSPSSNNTENSAQTLNKRCQGELGRELATAFTWDDVKTESALLCCPNCGHLITVAMFEPKDKSVGGTHETCHGCICMTEGMSHKINVSQKYLHLEFLHIMLSLDLERSARIL